MCGIFGFTNFKKDDLETARKALHTMEHRGPDQWNDYFDEDIYIGHQRLSILDLSENGKQPMLSPDRKVIITVNGEIYNFLELKKELEYKYKFNSTSDSEVLLYGYIEWGIDKLLEKIDGMYAFSIYDKQKDTLYLARDRVGIKPLYYSNLNGQISWASELKAIQKLYEDKNCLEYDYTAFYDFLTYLYIPTPKSMYKNVYKLEPAHYLKVNTKNNQFEKVKYWQLEIKRCNDDIETAKNKVMELLKKSINEQMIADVPVGFFLSGGLDSSTVVGVASQEHTNINTFAIGFNNKKKDERKFADIVSKHFSTQHKDIVLSDSDLSSIFDCIVEWYDEPNALSSSYPNYYVSKLTRKTCKVALTGDGGDEVFGGYNWYKDFVNIKNKYKIKNNFLRKSVQILKMRFSPFKNKAKKLEKKYFLNDLELYTRLMSGMLSDEKSYYKKKWNIPSEYDDYWYYRRFYKKELDLYTRLQYLDFHTFLPDACLAKVDRTSMKVSLECRVPLLSKELIEYLFSLNENVRIYNNELKGLMKVTIKNILPDSIIYRDKKGFSAPLKNISRSSFFKKEFLQEKFLKKFWSL